MPKKIIDRVTVTGADDSTDIPMMVDIQAEFPFVEWGILLSKSIMGVSRFPSLEWLETLNVHRAELNLSGHLCGRWVRDICDGNVDEAGTPTVLTDVPPFEFLFDRVQLNFHAYQHRIEDIGAFTRQVDKLADQVILQFDDVNNHLLTSVRLEGVDAVPLFDTSGGAGILPKEWPKVLNCYCGYAGGLSPDNLPEQMELISSKCGDGPIWIDAETWLRSDGDRVFDMEKVRAVLEEAKPWVIQS